MNHSETCLVGMSSTQDLFHLLCQDDAVVLLLEPRLGVFRCDQVVNADLRLAPPPLGDAEASFALHHHVEVHTVNARGRVVLQTQVDVLIDTETEVAGSAAGTRQSARSASVQLTSAPHPPCLATALAQTQTPHDSRYQAPGPAPFPSSGTACSRASARRRVDHGAADDASAANAPPSRLRAAVSPGV